jgi:hypothetical protein
LVRWQAKDEGKGEAEGSMKRKCICTADDHGHEPDFCEGSVNRGDGYCDRRAQLQIDEAEASRAEAGLRGQGAVVRSMTRLRDSIDRLNVSTQSYNNWLLALTVAMALVALIQLIAVFIKPVGPKR